MSDLDKLAYDFRHFALRLFERYGVRITFEYYKALSDIPHLKKSFVRLDKNGVPDSKIGLLKICNRKVLVLKSLKGNRSLRTALPIDHKEST